MALVPFVACLGGIPTPIIRAMMSKMVDPDEQGNETGFSSIDIELFQETLSSKTVRDNAERPKGNWGSWSFIVASHVSAT